MDPEITPSIESPPVGEDASPSVESTPELESSVQAAIRAIHSAESQARASRTELNEQVRLAKEYQELQAKAKEQPLDVINKFGLSLDDIEALRTTSVDPHEATTQKMQAMQEQFDALVASQRKEKADAAYAEVRSAVHHFASNETDYPHINRVGDKAKDLVYERVVAAYKSGSPLSESQAASEVEKELEAMRSLLLGEKASEQSPSTDTLTNPMSGTNGKQLSYKGLSLKEQDELFANRLSNLHKT